MKLMSDSNPTVDGSPYTPDAICVKRPANSRAKSCSHRAYNSFRDLRLYWSA